jgi:hypothetical protein
MDILEIYTATLAVLFAFYIVIYHGKRIYKIYKDSSVREKNPTQNNLIPCASEENQAKARPNWCLVCFFSAVGMLATQAAINHGIPHDDKKCRDQLKDESENTAHKALIQKRFE